MEAIAMQTYGADLASAQHKYDERERAILAEGRGIARMQREADERANAERSGRRAAGMGFWRLVWVVVVGVLLAQIIGVFSLWIINGVQDPDGDGETNFTDKCPDQRGSSVWKGCDSYDDLYKHGGF